MLSAIYSDLKKLINLEISQLAFKKMPYVYLQNTHPEDLENYLYSRRTKFSILGYILIVILLKTEKHKFN